MPNSGTEIIFFGTEEFSLAALRALVDAGYPVALVVTKPDRPHGRGLKVREPAVKTYARKHGIAVVQPQALSEIDADIAAITDRIGVLSSYGKIIPDATLALFERGIINVHPSLLPKYRGPSPIETALLDGAAETGVSIMRLVARMDAGPVYARETITISPGTAAGELYTLCAQTGSRLLVESLPAIIRGGLHAEQQDDAAATYTKLLNKKDAVVDPAVQTADEIERHVRAYEEYPRTRLIINGHDSIITRAHVGRSEAALTVPCADDSFLTVDRLIAPSGRTMSGADFVRGYK